MNTSPSCLKNQFLIAMPQMDDANFAQTLVYLVEHNDQGAMGLVINRPSGLNLADLVQQLRPEQSPPSRCQDVPIYAGGPVQTDRGFVLHPGTQSYQATLTLGELALSTSLDALFSIADGKVCHDYLIALGYAGWGSGQLEAELAQNGWLNCPARPDILFHTPSEQRREAAAQVLGIDLQLLSTQMGHA